MNYTSIYDCPVKVFRNIIRTSNVKLLQYDSSYDIILKALKSIRILGWLIKMPKQLSEIELWDIFESIGDERINVFGVPDNYQAEYFKQRTVNKLEINVLKGDLTLNTELQFQKRDLERIKKLNKILDSKENDKNQARIDAIIEKETGRSIDKLTIFEYETYVQDIHKKSIIDRNKHLKIA